MITEKELQAFFKICDMRGIPYRKTPRTKEETDNMIIVHNSLTGQFDVRNKNIPLKKFETIETAKDAFNIIMGIKQPVKVKEEIEYECNLD